MDHVEKTPKHYRHNMADQSYRLNQKPISYDVFVDRKCAACRKKHHAMIHDVKNRPICDACHGTMIRRHYDDRCVKCNEPLPPSSKNIFFHPDCKSQRKPYMGYVCGGYDCMKKQDDKSSSTRYSQYV